MEARPEEEEEDSVTSSEDEEEGDEIHIPMERLRNPLKDDHRNNNHFGKEDDNNSFHQTPSIIQSIDDYYKFVYNNQHEFMKSKDVDRHAAMSENIGSEQTIRNPIKPSLKSKTERIEPPEQTSLSIPNSKVETINNTETSIQMISNVSTNSFDLLPDEILYRIWSYLDAPSLGKAAQVNKRY
jgi:hypothetical protein